MILAKFSLILLIDVRESGNAARLICVQSSRSPRNDDRQRRCASGCFSRLAASHAHDSLKVSSALKERSRTCSHLAVCPGCSVPPCCRSAAAIGKSRRRDGRKRPAPAAPAATASAPAYTPLTADQLYQLVSPVALFPTSCWRRCWPARVIPTKSAPQMPGWCKTAACSRRRSARQPTLSPGIPACAAWCNSPTYSIRWRKTSPGPPPWAAPTSTIPPT